MSYSTDLCKYHIMQKQPYIYIYGKWSHSLMVDNSYPIIDMITSKTPNAIYRLLLSELWVSRVSYTTPNLICYCY